jgi:hypothetical protein
MRYTIIFIGWMLYLILTGVRFSNSGCLIAGGILRTIVLSITSPVDLASYIEGGIKEGAR